MAYEDYTVNQFKRAWFSQDYTEKGIPEDIFQTVLTEYVDTAGLYQSEEFEKVSYIHYISNRINSVKLGIRLQREFIENFGTPYLPGLDFFKAFGHILFWGKDENNLSSFLQTLKRIEEKEFKYESILKSKMKDLVDYRAKANKGEGSTKTTRASFIRTQNSLGKIGYKIDGDKTTVEEYAYMIKQQSEEYESFQNSKLNK